MPNHTDDDAKNKLKKAQPFFVIVVLVFVVWLMSSMAESREYRHTFRISYEGLDTVRYVVTEMDSSIEISYVCNGFTAVKQNLGKEPVIKLHIDSSEMDQFHNIVINANERIKQITSEARLNTANNVNVINPTIRVTLKPRTRRLYTPDIGAVTFKFEESYGLYGDIYTAPAVVALYGSEESLNDIKGVEARLQTVENISKSGFYKVALNTSWKKYGDVRSDCDSISVYIPVEHFVEKTFTLPINTTTTSDVQNIKVFPSTVDVVCLVAAKDYNEVQQNEFKANVDYNDKSGDKLTVSMERFPNKCRIMSINPREVRYTVIK